MAGAMRASNESDSSQETDESCIFCLIANDQDKETEVIKKNNELVCFRDIDPVAPHHYLVIPIEHILSCLSLHKGHIDLVKRMVQMGKAVLKEQGVTDMKNIRMGFHQPPYTSVDHLHLHVLAPASQISEYRVYKFTPKTYRFLTEKVLLKHLKDIDPPLSEKTGTSKEPLQTKSRTELHNQIKSLFNEKSYL